MTKLFMMDGTIMEVSNSIRCLSQACKDLNMSIYDICACRVEEDNTPIAYDTCYDYCNEVYKIDQSDWSKEAVERGAAWECSCSQEYDWEDDGSYCQPHEYWTFVECHNCGAPMHSIQVGTEPSSYSYKDEYDDSTHYCVGYADKDAYCSSCGANYEY